MRILFSRICAAIVIAILAVTGSAWDQHSTTIPSLLFAVAIFLVGIASIGRVWCSLYVAGYKDRLLVR